MKNLFIYFLSACALTFGFTSCDDDTMMENLPEGKNIVEIAIEGGYTSLAAALTRAGLVDDLQEDGPFTVFAPTNEAFDQLLVDLGLSSIDEIPVAVLQDVLLYHVLDLFVLSTEITNGDVATKQGASITLNTDAGITVNGIAVENPFDVVGTNGVIHTIGTVLSPPVVVEERDIIEIAIESGYTSLAAALTKAGLVETLQGEGPFTVFAPTNEAFDALLVAIGQPDIESIPADVLAQVLLYHVIEDNVPSSAVTNGDVPTAQGESVTFNTSGGITINDVAVINPFDVEASNGVIHTIGSVLAPESVARFINTVLEPAYFSESFTTLVEAVVKADLVETLLNTPNLTIFAPDNMAFETAGINPADVDVPTLTAVLTYHVLGSKEVSGTIEREEISLNSESLWFSFVSAGNFINGSTEIVAVDIESGTGVVHVINNVLLPPVGNIVETAVALTVSTGGEFTSLVAALQRTADEGTAEQNLITVLSSDGPFSVFAPTNAAFQALLDSNNDWNSLGDIPLETLIAVLTYHVVPARAYDKDLAGAVDMNDELPTAQGSNIKIDLNNFTINTNSNIIGVNTNATNGVIHVIDSVLLP